MYKKLKVDMKGNVIRDRVTKDPTGISVDDRYKKWKKTNLMGIQKEGESEIKSVSMKARSMLTKRTKGSVTSNRIKNSERFKKKDKNAPRMKKKTQKKKGLL